MNYEAFARILSTFADNSDAVANAKGELVVQIRDDVIHASVQTRSGDVYVIENGAEMSANQWLIERIARLPLLADRLLSLLPTEKNFVIPSGDLLPQLVDESTSDERVRVADVVEAVRFALDTRPAGTTSVLYLTSNAGEGKTTLINQVARIQASAYRDKKADWMLVPITLGGKPFLRFDDLIVGTLMNRFRFPFFYHNSFLELVKLGVLVPAFDGFEEMFVESSSGEALSALGNLVQSLDSAGTILISARKAYFEYKSFANQARLFDSIKTDNAVFSSLAINRWSKEQFIGYCKIRGLSDAESMYESVALRFGETHPLLTRAVLVKRLVDVAGGLSERDALLSKLGQAPHDYFYEFVDAIIEREASEKWIDRSGDPARPLITVDEHHELLSFIAQEMWLLGSIEIHEDSLDLIVELNAEGHRQDTKITRQVKERIKQHALLVSSGSAGTTFAFDHEEFRDFFLGQAIGRRLIEGADSDLRSILREAPLPRQAFGSAVQYLVRRGFDFEKTIRRVMSFGHNEHASSFIRENCGGLIIRMLTIRPWDGLAVHDTTFPVDALANRKIHGVKFTDCYFQTSELGEAELEKCEFTKCRFDRLEMSPSAQAEGSSLRECEVVSVIPTGSDAGIYAPDLIKATLSEIGFEIVGDEEVQSECPVRQDPDENMVLVDKLLRCFVRSTAVGDGVLKLRMGAKANQFIKERIPELLKIGVLVHPESGPGRDDHYRLNVPMRELDKAMASSEGSYDAFLEYFSDRLS